MSVSPNILAIVGRPNVGKSALFNRIVGRRVSIVHEQAGVTRDRVSAAARWHDKTFEVVDTGGIAFMDDEKTDDVLAAAAREQAEVAIEMADALILVVDVSAGVTPLDREIARKLRASGKPIFLAVNKVDNDSRARGVDEFTELGFDPMFPIAAVHGIGVESLVSAATKDFVSASEVESAAAAPTRIAIVGRPNVGKSSLINSILQSERTIVSDIAGTTRDSVDAPFTLDGKNYVLVDTAGLRHKRKIATSVDQFGLMRAERSIRECDVAVLVLDARDGVTKQDKSIAGKIFEANRACVIIVNKWDLAATEERKGKVATEKGKKPKSFREEYEAAMKKELFFLDWAPVIFASAKTGQNVPDLFRQVGVIEKEMKRRVETPQLNQTLSRAIQSYSPPIVSGRRFKIFYAFQKESQPPTFLMFVNDEKCLTPHYERFLIARLRAAWGFTGCPVLLKLRQRERRKFVRGHRNVAEKKNFRHGEDFS
jgi:GTP-binding protein